MTRNYYKILGIKSDADMEEIKNSYRRLALLYHPDKCRDPQSLEKMKEINEAYSLLKNPIRRLRYDRECRNTYKQKKPEAAEDVFTFSAREVLDKSNGLLPPMHLSSSAAAGFDEVLKGKRLLKCYFIFFKTVDKISGQVIKEISRKIDQYMERDRHFLPEIYLVLAVRKGISPGELKLFETIGNVINISAFSYATGKFYSSINQMH